jgi:hypothetical protein
VKRAAKSSNGLNMARNRMIQMSDDERSAITADRLIASYGLTLSEADHLIRSIRRA